MTATRLALASIFSLALLAQGCIIVDDDDGGDSILTIDNQSDYALYEVYIAAIDDPTWGPDLTGSDILYPGEILDVFDIDCDFYDVLVVDELGTECELLDIDLCFSDAVWVVTNGTLARCDGFVTGTDGGFGGKGKGAADASSPDA